MQSPRSREILEYQALNSRPTRTRNRLIYVSVLVAVVAELFSEGALTACRWYEGRHWIGPTAHAHLYKSLVVNAPLLSAFIAYLIIDVVIFVRVLPRVATPIWGSVFCAQVMSLLVLFALIIDRDFANFN